MSVIISEGITKIDSYAFSECGDLTEVTLPNNLKTLCYGSFSNCPELAFTVYKNGKYLGNAGNPHLALVAKENPNYSSVDGVLYDKKVTRLIQVPGGLAHCVVPKSVTTIGAGRFSNAESWTM